MMPRITASEAVYGFAAWLTTRPGTLRVGSRHNAATMACLVTRWLETNRLPEPREASYPKNIKQPKEKPDAKP